MKTATICHEIPCDQSVAERPRYFPRQLITPDDLNLEQDYFRSRLRWHNRMLHGWGVVCGARVCGVPKSKENGASSEPWKVLIKPGYILGPYGDEIIIDCARTFDLRTRGVTGITGETCVDVIDPWCSEVVQRPEGNTLYVAVKYREIATRPVRVQPVGCGCDDAACENSRLVDGYEIGALTYCPDSHQKPTGMDDLTKGAIPDCPPCPDEPWVVLAKVTLDADGNISEIHNCDCRRLVVSHAVEWRKCSESEAALPPREQVRVDAVEAREKLVAGGKSLVIIRGEHLDQVASVNFGERTTAAVIKTAPNIIEVAVTVDGQAKPGPRTVVLEDKLGKRVERKDALTIEAVATGGPELSPPAEPVKPAPSRPRGGQGPGSKRRRKTSDEEV